VKDFLKKNGILILVIALLLALITAVLSFTFGGFAPPTTNVVGTVATPFRNVADAFVGWVEEIYSDAFLREDMEKELEALRKENAALKDQARQGEAALRENERLRHLVGLAVEHPDFDKVDAKVTAYGSDNWYSTLTIGKGSAADISPGDCVVDEYGYLVGVVSVVGLNWSTVRTVVDVELEMGALISRTDEAALMEGDFRLMGEGKLKLTYLPQDGDLQTGDTIVTSGLRSGETATYPSGLVVGCIEEVVRNENGIGSYAVVAPAADLDALEQVFVIRDFSGAS